MVFGVSPFRGSPCLHRSLLLGAPMLGFGKRIAEDHYYFANAKSQKWNSRDGARVQIGVPVNIRAAAVARCSWLQLSASLRVLAICQSFYSSTDWMLDVAAVCRTISVHL